MTKYQFTITVPASGGSNRVNVAAAAIAAGAVIQGYSPLYSASYLPASKLFFQMAAGDSGLGFVGGPLVDQAGTNSDFQLTSAAAAPGGSTSDESHTDSDLLNLGQFYVHGTVPGDVNVE